MEHSENILGGVKNKNKDDRSLIKNLMFTQNTSPQDTTWSPLGWPKLKRLFKPHVERTWISQNSPIHQVGIQKPQPLWKTVL